MKEYIWTRGLNRFDRKISQVRGTGLESWFEELKEDMEFRSQEIRSCSNVSSESNLQTNTVWETPILTLFLWRDTSTMHRPEHQSCAHSATNLGEIFLLTWGMTTSDAICAYSLHATVIYWINNNKYKNRPTF